MPTKLARYSQLDKLEEAEELDITVCMECGTCAYTCPANIPLVQWIRLGKKRVMEKQKGMLFCWHDLYLWRHVGWIAV